MSQKNALYNKIKILSALKMFEQNENVSAQECLKFAQSSRNWGGEKGHKKYVENVFSL